MIRTVLIDDEPLARDIIKYYLNSHGNYEIVAECCDGFEGLKAIAEYKPDLVFLDVQMPKISGFEMLELVEQNLNVIFTTAFDEYAIKAFEVSAIDYLLKPIEQSRFKDALKKIEDRIGSENLVINTVQINESLNTQNHRIVVKHNGSIKIIPIDEVNYLEAADDLVKISTGDGIFYKNKTMNFFENALPADKFIRIHRSYIINLNQINKLELKEKDSYVVQLKSDIWLPISKTGYQKLKSVLGL